MERRETKGDRRETYQVDKSLLFNIRTRERRDVVFPPITPIPIQTDISLFFIFYFSHVSLIVENYISIYFTSNW